MHMKVTVLLCCLITTVQVQANRVTFIVLSQPNSYHEHRASLFRDRFQSQVKDLKQAEVPELLFTHSDFVDVTGSWTVFPLINAFIGSQHEKKKTKWVFFCEDDTQVNIKGLLALLAKYKANKNHFLGRGLHDEQSTIIHHFADPKKFAYPDFLAGFAMSIGLLRNIKEQLEHKKLKTDFSIDPKHELAHFLWDEGQGTPLTNVPEFCSVAESSKSDCITWQPVRFPECPQPIDPDNLFVAVKTCKKFYDSRVKVVKETWDKEASLITYYSEEEDRDIPTVSLGVPNTDRGHCGKTMAIIRRFIATPHETSPRWLLIADDDTIINLERLRGLLACHNEDQPVALGERYGYGVAKGGGYDYITGGGGMVFSFPAARLLSDKCQCYADNSPDDMTLGMCLKGIGVPVTHSRYFHQARPEDYSKELLSNQLPVSFHKHWNVDPYKVYASLTKEPLPPRTSRPDSPQNGNRDEL